MKTIAQTLVALVALSGAIWIYMIVILMVSLPLIAWVLSRDWKWLESIIEKVRPYLVLGLVGLMVWILSSFLEKHEVPSEFCGMVILQAILAYTVKSLVKRERQNRFRFRDRTSAEDDGYRYANEHSWSYDKMIRGALRGVSKEDAPGLNDSQLRNVTAFCRYRVNELAAEVNSLS